MRRLAWLLVVLPAGGCGRGGKREPRATRRVEGRVSDESQRGWRPFVPGPPSPPRARDLADLEARRDARGVAAAHVFAGRVDQAEAALGDAAGPEAASDRALIRLLRGDAAATGDPTELARVRQALELYRANYSKTAGSTAYLDLLDRRLTLVGDAARGRALLEQAITEAEAARAEDVNADLARSHAFKALALEAARRGAGAELLGLLSRQARLPEPPVRCAVAVVAGDALLVVVRGAGGQDGLELGSVRPAAGHDPDRVVPPRLAATLEGCDVVDVLAGSPLRGLPGLLPATVAWRYRGFPERASPPPPDGAGTTGGGRLVVVDVAVPRELGLPPVARRYPGGEGETVLRGADTGVSEASHLALAPDEDGSYTLTPANVRGLALGRAPLVILGACYSAKTAPMEHSTGGLPDAFLAAGARAVLAAPHSIPDAEATAVLASLRRRIDAGTPPARALRDERVAHPGGWVAQLVLFESM